MLISQIAAPISSVYRLSFRYVAHPEYFEDGMSLESLRFDLFLGHVILALNFWLHNICKMMDRISRRRMSWQPIIDPIHPLWSAVRKMESGSMLYSYENILFLFIVDNRPETCTKHLRILIKNIPSILYYGSCEAACLQFYFSLYTYPSRCSVFLLIEADDWKWMNNFHERSTESVKYRETTGVGCFNYLRKLQAITIKLFALDEYQNRDRVLLWIYLLEMQLEAFDWRMTDIQAASTLLSIEALPSWYLSIQLDPFIGNESSCEIQCQGVYAGRPRAASRRLTRSIALSRKLS